VQALRRRLQRGQLVPDVPVAEVLAVLAVGRRHRIVVVLERRGGIGGGARRRRRGMELERHPERAAVLLDRRRLQRPVPDVRSQGIGTTAASAVHDDPPSTIDHDRRAGSVVTDACPGCPSTLACRDGSCGTGGHCRPGGAGRSGRRARDDAARRLSEAHAIRRVRGDAETAAAVDRSGGPTAQGSSPAAYALFLAVLLGIIGWTIRVRVVRGRSSTS